ncbi:MAG: EAL domain-containing protein [Bacilli bacterium]
MKNKKKVIISAVLFSLAFIDIAIFIILSFIKTIVNVALYSTILWGQAIAYAIIAIITYISYLNDYRVSKIIEEENHDKLSRHNRFIFNTFIFTAKANKILFKHKNENGYIVKFSVSKENSTTNQTIKKMNSFVVDFLESYFSEKKSINKRKVIYCFANKSFYVLKICSFEEIDQMITEIENQIYKIHKEKDIRVFVQPYFGITPINGEKSAVKLMSQASLAKIYGENNYQVVTMYRESMNEEQSEEEIDEIRRAFYNNEFVVYYQPKYHLNSKSFISSEALIRWNSSEHKQILTPDKFIEKAEACGLIHQLDMFVYKTVIQDLVDAKRRGRRLLPVSVNFSLYEFYNPDFYRDITSLIEENNINPSLIEIEITEGTSNANTFLAISLIKKLKEYGIRVLMDDFGIGYSNISNLSKIPLDVVKLDRSFITDISIDRKKRDIVKFLIELCKCNGLEVVAEGVEDSKTIEILKKFKCDTIQGFYYSKPLPKNEYEKFLLNNPFEKKGDNSL